MVDVSLSTADVLGNITSPGNVGQEIHRDPSIKADGSCLGKSLWTFLLCSLDLTGESR